MTMLPCNQTGLRHWPWVGIAIAVVFVFLGNYLHSGLPSDAAYIAALVSAMAVTTGIVIWAQSSARVRALMFSALLLLSLSQTLDLSENFDALLGVPILGKDSYWNGRITSIGLSLGILLVFLALLLALVETHEGRLAQRRYQLLADNITDVISTNDLNLKNTYVSPSVTKLRGYTVEEALKQSPEEIMTPDSLARARALLEAELGRILHGLRNPDEASTIELEFRRKDGSTVWAETGVRPLLDSNGQPTGVLAVSRDISERKRAQKTRARLEAQLNQAQKMESVGRLAGGVAHDFNNMLGVILGHAELALIEGDSDTSTRAHLEEIQRFCTRAGDLTRQLLAFARQQTVSLHPIHLNAAVENMATMLRRLIGSEVQLQWTPGHVLWPVMMDRSQLDQILVNLCVNARDAMSGAGEIDIRTENLSLDQPDALPFPGFEPGDFVRLTVRDNGHGMRPEVRDRAFEPFYTTKELGKGTGLGLATVYGIVKQNNGFIALHSAPGEGTTVEIHLPRLHDMPESDVKDKQAISTDIRGTETILMVEDEVALLGATQSLLVRMGYTVFAASDPHEAIEIFQRRNGAIDLLLTDVIMPGMNGRELAARLADRDPDLRILYMSGYAADLFGEDGILEEGVNFIQKPFNFKNLAGRIRQILDGNGMADIPTPADP